MRFEGTLDIAAPRYRVWAFLTDPKQVTACAPDLQSLDIADPTHFKVVVRAGVGPIKGTFTMNVEFTDLREPEHAGVLARGQAPGSAVEMRNTMDLEAKDGRTTMRWASDVNVSGMIAQVGARLMQGAADKITQQVFACIKTKLEAPVPT
ncbi:MAG TPA: carbon monoxide dehydrogenase subunit G [Candidatus Limnocylindria bacterium]|jgi:carbon monoxide dehydrogenase subunit G|nr:carbon monoxide dehydrogenase subunit G [Candidatus Limnocylindria bacterium]